MLSAIGIIRFLASSTIKIVILYSLILLVITGTAIAVGGNFYNVVMWTPAKFIGIPSGGIVSMICASLLTGWWEGKNIRNYKFYIVALVLYSAAIGVVLFVSSGVYVSGIYPQFSIIWTCGFLLGVIVDILIRRQRGREDDVLQQFD